jgi:NAD(P)-dependent dehydrogenase (short-subunit alcohol dehydrogenase family)
MERGRSSIGPRANVAQVGGMGAPWAVVTGASRGIGKAVAVRLAQDGFALCLVASTTHGCDATLGEIESEGGRAETFGCDLGDRAQVRGLVADLLERHPTIEVLVNNAGIAGTAHFPEFPDSLWDEIMAVNLDSVFVLSRGLVPALRAARSGASIVNVSSVLSLLAADGTAAYMASKAALNHLTRAMAVELGRDGIRVNAIAPGFIRTDMFETSHPPDRQIALAESHALGRVGESAEVAAVVSFLCSRDASFVSGAVIPVDGALTCHLAIPRII